MFFQHVYEKGLAQASYIIGCQASKTAIVIDPKRDIDTYIDIAAREHLNITYVAETHIHADFLSGAQELVDASGAELLLSDEGGPEWQYQFPHTGLHAGDVFMVGNIKFEVIHTPGHTPEHISFLVTNTPAGDYPIMVFTGDFVFVGDIGRPDLLEKAAGITGTQEVGARDMFASLHQFNALPDYVQVWPGHGAGSACGKALGAVPSSTVGYEKQTNWAMQYDDQDAFVDALLAGQPEPPKYFAMMKQLNKTTRPLATTLTTPKQLTVDEVDRAMSNGMPVIDTRDKTVFGQHHIPGSVNIQDIRSFSTWAGWILDYETPFVIVAAPHRMPEIVKALIRIGLDHIYGYIPDIEDWIKTEKPVASVTEISPHDLNDALGRGRAQVIDVRGSAEYQQGHIANALHIHVGELMDYIHRLPSDKPLVVQCETGDRSAIAYSLLAKHGVQNLLNLSGGIQAWLNKGYDVQNAA